jgi:hypothetical protein
LSAEVHEQLELRLSDREETLVLLERICLGVSTPDERNQLRLKVRDLLAKQHDHASTKTQLRSEKIRHTKTMNLLHGLQDQLADYKRLVCGGCRR